MSNRYVYYQAADMSWYVQDTQTGREAIVSNATAAQMLILFWKG